MNKQVLSTLTALAAALVLATPAFATDAHHPEKKAEAATAQAQPAAPSTRQIVQKMQANVKKMQLQLTRIANAKTDEARQQALDAYMTSLHDNMEMTHSLQPAMMNCEGMEGMGEGMMGHMVHMSRMAHPGMNQGAMGQGRMGMMEGHAQPQASSERMDQLEKRMDMMQQMMKERQPAPAAK